MTEMETMSKDYLSVKKKVFYIEMDNGVHGGVFFYQIRFRKKIRRKTFLNIMNNARKSGNRYADLTDRSFQEKYGIAAFEEIYVDYQDMLEEKYWCTRRNPETGEIELVDEDEYEEEYEEE